MTVDEYKLEVKRIRPGLVVTALRYMGDADEAEDVVQDVLLKMWQLIDTLQLPLDRFGNILVRNRCIDALRRKPQMAVISEDISAPQNEADERLDKVMAIIRHLPDMQQTVVQLRHMDGLEMSEIAALMGTSEVAVRKTLSRSRQAILKSFKNHDYGQN
jgi:RNA polymerase sigma-70 factor (ECF subfamily)